MSALARIELSLPPPLSACFTNVQGRGRVPTKRYKDWQKEALWLIAAQKVGRIKGQVSIAARFVAPDRRPRDAGNLDKALCDILVKAGVIEDDSNRFVRRLTYEWVDAGPPCVVIVQEHIAEMAA